MLWGGRGTANKHHWHVWGVFTVFQPHWFCPHSRHVCFPCLHCSGSRLLYRERALSCVHFPGLSRSRSGSWVLHKGTDSVGPVFCAFPCPSSSGSQELEERTLLRCSVTYPLPIPASVSGCAQSGAPCVSSGELISWLWPSWQMSTIQNLRKSLVRNWKPVCTLVGDAISGAKFAPFWLWLAPASTLSPAFGRGWASPQPASSSLVLLSLLFCELAGSAFLSLSLWWSHSLGYYLMLAPSDCPQGIQVQSLP